MKISWQSYWWLNLFHFTVMSYFAVYPTGEEVHCVAYKSGEAIVLNFTDFQQIQILDIKCYFTGRHWNRLLLAKWKNSNVADDYCKNRCQLTLKEFRLQKSHITDTGKYECVRTESGHLKMMKSFHVNAIVTDDQLKPNISMNTTLIHTGATVKMTCNLPNLMNCPRRVTWEKDKDILKNKDWPRRPLHDKEIVLENVSARDEGSYTCEMYDVANSGPSVALKLKVVPTGYTLPIGSTEKPSSVIHHKENDLSHLGYSGTNDDILGLSSYQGETSRHRRPINSVTVVFITALAAIVIAVITAQLWKVWRKGKHNKRDRRMQLKPLQALEGLRRPSEVSNGPGSPTSGVYATIDEYMVKSDPKPEVDSRQVMNESEMTIGTYVLSKGKSIEVTFDTSALNSEVIEGIVGKVDMCENPIYDHSEETCCDAKDTQPAKQDVFVYDHIGGPNLPASSRIQRGVSPTNGLRTPSENEAGCEEENT